MNSQDVIITRHREPLPGPNPKSDSGYVRAEGGGLVLSAPITLSLLDDPNPEFQREVDNRLRELHQEQLDRMRATTDGKP